jgi:Fe-S-cluster containining protein
LHTFQVRSLVELDQAVYLLNFDRIELGLSPAGDWSVYYRYPCRFLDRDDFTCRIHEQPQQPRVCVHYNPYHCWYRRVLPKRVTSEFLRIDRHRLEYVITRLAFDSDGTIVDRPDWALLVEGIAALPPPPPTRCGDPPGEDAATSRWKELAVLDSAVATLPQVAPRFSYAEQQNPCDGCAAYCCKTLAFPVESPANRPGLDYLQYALGFPGVELAVTDDIWSLVVRTTCRHLKEDRCSIYGQPERPLVCKYYDAWKCTYRVHFGLPRPPGMVRLRLEEFAWLTECFRFDEFGATLERLPVDAIREHIEAQYRLQAHQDSPTPP